MCPGREGASRPREGRQAKDEGEGEVEAGVAEDGGVGDAHKEREQNLAADVGEDLALCVPLGTSEAAVSAVVAFEEHKDEEEHDIEHLQEGPREGSGEAPGRRVGRGVDRILEHAGGGAEEGDDELGRVNLLHDCILEQVDVFDLPLARVVRGVDDAEVDLHLGQLVEEPVDQLVDALVVHARARGESRERVCHGQPNDKEDEQRDRQGKEDRPLARQLDEPPRPRPAALAERVLARQHVDEGREDVLE
mmetsp:Transcript_40002/g.133386  ORF Transcript_40002/g.133386 Transcript_40002/m.133386 type:complete len:249 (-) Transcript_40002:539-1285(-)